jgi:hypothetical protein
LDLLKDEYIQLQSFYEDIDKRALTIKGWNITISLASIGAGFLISPYLWPIAALAAIMFWYLEAFWRNYHYFLSVRITEIENALNNDTWINLVPLQLYTTWSKAFKKVGSRTSKYFFKPVTLFPHLFIILLCIGLYILWNFGIIQVPIKLNPNN